MTKNELVDAGYTFNAVEDSGPPYVFDNPGHVRIQTRTEDQQAVCDTRGQKWTWRDGGIASSVDWSRLQFPRQLEEVAKAFLFNRLQTRAPDTAGMDVDCFRRIKEGGFDQQFPWQPTDAVAALVYVSTYGARFVSSLRAFYYWCLVTEKPGFSREVYFQLGEVKIAGPSPYQHLFLHQTYIAPDSELAILQAIEDTYDVDDWRSLGQNVLLQLAFEVAPRPIQIHSLDESDLVCISSEETRSPEATYFSLNLPMAKKVGGGAPKRRARKISYALGTKIQRLIESNGVLFGQENSKALFRNVHGRRMSTPLIGDAIVTALEAAGLPPSTGTTMLRHHLGQGLADQGAPIEVIAEVLGHNSSVPARAYIAATPKIAVIKTRALGRNKTYARVMKAMLTGEVTGRADVPRERWVRGTVETVYIEGIGGCALPPATLCPKNPVYSCYGCKKFNPFIDGPHQRVRAALEEHAKLFIGASSEAMELDRSRVPLQLERTIEAVDAVIARCSEAAATEGS
jgi:integrase